jgi:uncharacterized protein (TIGR02452 family)
MNRSDRTILAKETVKIVNRGVYKVRDGRVVNIAASVESCLAGTRYFPPEELERIRQEVAARPVQDGKTIIEVCNKTTLTGIKRLLAQAGHPVAALNFASAKNPGGGFLAGSQAQEESLARSSALHASLLRGSEYYERHRASSSCLYSDAMILSPACPVFRSDAGELLDQPYLATFITSAAPNAGAVANNAPQQVSLIPEVLQRRSEYVLALAAWHGCENLVLGAWGCGVFRNDPSMVAQLFANHLRGKWSGRFRHVLFSVLDMSPGQETFVAFQRALV